LANALPSPVSYHGPITNTDRWQNFVHRADDIFVCTPPKCGTTWTQAICAMLVFGKVDHGQQPGVVSPWLDAEFAPIEDDLAQLEAQQHRRYIKTHSPLDGIPYHADAHYLAVFRDPRDVYCSGINHRDNMTDAELANAAFPSGENQYQDWLYKVREPGTWDLQSLDSLTHFLKSYWDYRHLDNVHLFHYSDMKRDLKANIARIAVLLGYDYDDTQIQSFAESATFSSMKQNAEQFAPNSGTGMWKQESHFFANGSNEQWRKVFSDADLEAFNKRLADLLPAEQADWILHGDG